MTDLLASLLACAMLAGGLWMVETLLRKSCERDKQRRDYRVDAMAFKYACMNKDDLLKLRDAKVYESIGVNNQLAALEPIEAIDKALMLKNLIAENKKTYN